MEYGRNQKQFYYFLALIFAIHALAIFHKLKDHFELPQITTPQAVKLKFMKPEDIQKLFPKSIDAKQQVVQTEQQLEKKKPTKTAFLGESDQSFDRETIAAKIDVFNTAGKGVKNGAKTDVQQKVSKSQTKKKEISLGDLGVGNTTPYEKYLEQKAQMATREGLENGSEKSRGISSTNDYIEHKQLGDFTHLNTVEFKFYGFYHRIRQKLEQFWGQSLQEKADMIYRSGRKIASDENHTTALIVTLNDKGEIVQVKVKSASGLKELDDAAIESFNKAGPFPNPPRGMLENGYATIEWGFVVKS